MKNIAYKVAKGDPNLPDGFITEHFETDQESLEGYSIAPLEVFNVLFQNNAALIRVAEVARGVVPAEPNQMQPQRMITVAEPVPQAIPVQAEPVPEQPSSNNTELFNQFMAWVAAGKPPANNT